MMFKLSPIYAISRFKNILLFDQESDRVENMTLSWVFLTNFDLFPIFGNVVKHCLKCLIYLLNRN